MQRVRRNLLAAGTAMLVLPRARAAEAWPNRAVTLLEPYGPGTNLDAITRYLSERLTRQWNVPVVVDYRAGANGVIGTEFVARSAPDGYMWLFTGPGHFTNEVLMGKVPFDPIKDFRPVARLASVMLVLVVPADSPIHSVKDLLDAARKDPDKLRYASAGSGSAQHLAAAGFQAAAKLAIQHIPYKTQSAALVATIGGQIDFTFAALATAAGQLQAGKLRALAVTGPRRSQSLPDLPTVAESGVPGYEFFSFNAVFVPAHTPDAIVRKFSDAIGTAVRDPKFSEMAKIQGFESDYADMRQWTAAVPGEQAKWVNLIRISGAKSE